METVHTQLVSCLSFVRESLRTGSQGEVMKIKKTVVKQIKEMTNNFKPDMLPPCEPANVKFTPLSDLTLACQQFGKVYLQHASPENCYAVGKGLEVADIYEKATAILHVVNDKGKACTKPVETLTCELVSDEDIGCSVKKTEASGQYEISYQTTRRGKHQLHIKVEGKHIKGSPFPVTVKLPVKMLGTPIKTISGIKKPWGVAVNQREEIIIAESSKNCVSIFSPKGEKIRSFGSKGSGDGLFQFPRGVAVYDDGSILVVDSDNHRIQKFTSDGKFITASGKRGDKKLEFICPYGINIHPHTRMVYVADQSNHRIQILNPDLTYFCSFGSRGDNNGQFKYPWDLAFDNIGNVYVADCDNHRIQVFTAEGEFLRRFGKPGKHNGELSFPTSVDIDSDNVVYVASNNGVSVFTCEGKFLVSFGTEGSETGQFHHPSGITVDKNGVVYVSDTYNARLQIF